MSAEVEHARLRALGNTLRILNEAAVRSVLDDYHLAGTPDELVERICLIQNALIRQIVEGSKVAGELHDAINKSTEEAAQRFVDGFRECADQVRAHGIEMGLAPAVVKGLLRNDVRERESQDKDRAATQRVQWSRG